MTTAAELVADADPKLNRLGALYYFDPQTVEKAKALGLDGFRMYFLGRGGVLGDVESHVVWGAFGYFNPAVVKKMWDSACEIMAPREAARKYLAWGAEAGQRLFGEVEGLDAFNTAAAKVIDSVNPAALPLFAGTAAEPVPADPAGAALFNSIVLRELRGGVHLIALVATGIDPLVAHAHRRPDAGPMFGWEALPTASNTDIALIGEADRLTDKLMEKHYSVLSSAEAAALTAGVDAMIAALPAD